MKSVIVATSVHPDFDKRVWRHCKALAREGVKVHLICPWDVEEGEQQQGVLLHPFPPARGLRERLFAVPTRIGPIIDRLLDESSVLHVHDPDLLFLACRYNKRLATVYDCHEFFDEQARQRSYIPAVLRPLAAKIIDWVEKGLAKRVGNVAVAAEGLVPRFASHGIPAILVGNEASEDVLATVNEDWEGRAPALVFIGSQHEDNGSLLFLDVAARLHEKFPNLKFIASDRFRDPAFRRLYMEEADRLGISKQLVMHPNVMAHQIMQVLNLGTVAISPNLRTKSQVTGNHTKMYEFMAAGLPNVCSDFPHQQKLIEECQSGLVARPEEPETFANAIAKLLEDDELRLQLGRNGQRAFKERYCYERGMPALVKFYEQALQRRGLEA